MDEHSDLPPRPSPPRRLVDMAAAWSAWFGIGRLIATAVCTLIVGAGAYWLVRAPSPPPEAELPFAASGSSAPVTVTLPPPAGVVAEIQRQRIVVHVAGAVRAPGVYELMVGDRVHDAVSLAGGAAADADPAGLNLAAPLVDGARIYVPMLGEVDPAALPSALPVDVVGGDPTGPIDLNRATAEQFELLPGVGPATAAAIVGDRERNGPFASVDDLDRVPGIGPAKLAALADLVTV